MTPDDLMVLVGTTLVLVGVILFVCGVILTRLARIERKQMIMLSKLNNHQPDTDFTEM